MRNARNARIYEKHQNIVVVRNKKPTQPKINPKHDRMLITIWAEGSPRV